MTEMSAGIYGGGGEATTPIYSGGNTCTVVFSVESVIESYSESDSLYNRLHCKKTFSPQSAQRTPRFIDDFALLKLCALRVLGGEGFLQ